MSGLRDLTRPSGGWCCGWRRDPHHVTELHHDPPVPLCAVCRRRWHTDQENTDDQHP